MRRSVTLSELLDEVCGVAARSGDTAVSGVSADSRRVQPGDLFVAYRGFEADGHDFIEPVGPAFWERRS